MAAVGAAVATHDDLQGRGSPPERFVRKPPDHRVPRNPFAAAATAPLVELDDAASDHRAVGLEPLPNGFETELIQSAERGQVRASEGSVVHVEVFRMGSVRTSILGRPRLLSRHRRAVSFYTLICEEPHMRPPGGPRLDVANLGHDGPPVLLRLCGKLLLHAVTETTDDDG